MHSDSIYTDLVNCISLKGDYVALKSYPRLNLIGFESVLCSTRATMQCFEIRGEIEVKVGPSFSPVVIDLWISHE